MLRGILVFAAGFALSIGAARLVWPKLLYSKVQQPLQFNHEVHTGQKGNMTCDGCHSLREDGSFAGVPKLEGCSTCHAAPMGESKAEKQLVDQYLQPGREPQWLRYMHQPDNAYFPHAPHIQRAKLSCETCHGGQGKSKSLAPVSINRISTYNPGIKRMDDCIACHRSKGLEHSCLDCHK